MKSDAKKLGLQVQCIEVRASENGQNVYLAMSPPAPLPAVDGYGNPVAHPPPPTATMRLFVTSDERRDAMTKANAVKLAAKKVRPELLDGDSAVAASKEKKAMTLELERLIGIANDAPEFRFKHGKTYTIVITEAAGSEGAGK